MRYNGIICFLVPKRAILGNWGHITACRTARRPPSGKLKVSRVASGYVDVMISLSRVCLSPKKRDFMGAAQKNLIFGLFLGQKWALAAPQELVRQHERHKNVVLLVSGHDGNEKIGGCGQKIDFWPKKNTFGPKKGHFGQSGPRNGPPSGQTAIHRKTKGIQSHLRTWGTCDQSGPVRLTQKNGGFIGVAQKNAEFRAKNAVFWPEIHFFRKSSNFFVTIMTGHQKDNIFVLTPLHGGPRGGRRGPFLARKSAFFYATPIQPPFFGVRRTRLNGIISPPHPEATPDNSGPPAGGRSATHRKTEGIQSHLRTWG